MRKQNLLTLIIIILTTSACMSTERSYDPENREDFNYDKSKSFAMNVVDGSLDFHNGLIDANVAEDADITADALSKASDTYLGFINGGLGGALLGLFGSSYGEYPLNAGYGIYYVPISDRSIKSIDAAYEFVNNQIIKATESEYGIKYSYSIWTASHSYEMIYEGPYCTDLQAKIYPNGKKLYTERYMQKRNITELNQCVKSGYNNISLMKFTTTTPKGEKGNYAVMGIRAMGWYTNFKVVDKLDPNFYYLRPVSKINNAPFVYNDAKAWFFINPKSGIKDNITKQQLSNVFPKIIY
ncbi:hypothetical protein [Shewanella saliphila]|uniref:Lipoprotein n=1 Tax=Shewanella saliphila TaxID=2282698 RepID=A0ABQ2QAS4_9GAMM|nr:hypothetical protein [Shewanella saliphila]MCL1103487.1 hypothetical protein [Shewanella saliphila]GGP69909.1 hypothetical protein GCM10009409_38300 [Shewanella saliphila]